MNVYQKFREWASRNNVSGQRYGILYARLSRSPAAKRAWAGK